MSAVLVLLAAARVVTGEARALPVRQEAARQEAVRQEETVPPNGESWELFQGMQGRRIDLSVPSGPCELAAARLAEAVRLQSGLEVSLDPAARDPDAIRVLAGAPNDPALEPLARACGVEPLEQGFRVLGREYRASGDAAVAVFEDPARAGRPLCLVLGNDASELAVYLDGIPRLSRPHLWVHADGELALECPLALDGRPRAEAAQDYVARRAEYFAGNLEQRLESFQVFARSNPDGERWRLYRIVLVGTRRRVLSWLGTEEAPIVELFFYDHLEDFEHCLGTRALSVPNRLRPRVHILLAQGMPDDGAVGLARVLARGIAGEAAYPWVEDGLAVAASGRWWGRSLDEWIGKLAAGRLLPPLEELGSPLASTRWSEHVLLPARALLFQTAALGDRSDPGAVRAIWKGADVGGVGVRYQRALVEASGAAAGGARQRVAQARREHARLPADFLQGIALQDGEQAGYSARAVSAALEEVRALGDGPNAVSLTVFASATNPRPAPCAPRGRSAHGSADDFALASACAAARQHGMGVLLALEVLAQPNGAWADNLSWTGEDDQTVFWERYERVALHYALLSELLAIEIFSFGANLRDVSRTEITSSRDPQKIFERRRAWDGLVARLRAAYAGGLTYAARFPGEAQEAGFFALLDYVGITLFPKVVAGTEEPDHGKLRGGVRYDLQRAIDLAVRWNKPLLLVQLGFPARAASWSRPMVPSGAVDPGAQQRFHEALADALRMKFPNSEVLRGFFLWNWSIGAVPGDGGFSLRGQPAESALRRLFER